MLAVVAAQFLSAMADNALLFGALALLRFEHYPAWTEPLLQEFFVLAFIILAPFAGPFADGLPKGRVMLISNGLKLVGALGMWVGSIPSCPMAWWAWERRLTHLRSTAFCRSWSRLTCS